MKIDDLEKLAKRANQRLRQMEKSGVAKISSAYRELSARAYDRRGSMTMTKSGNIAFRRDFSKMSTAELADLAENLEAFFGLKTTTVRATREAYEASYKTYMERATGKKAKLEGKAYTPLTRSQYNALWTASSSKAFGYEKVLNVAKRTGNLDNIQYLNEALADAIADQADLKQEISEDELVSKVLEYMEQHPKEG